MRCGACESSKCRPQNRSFRLFLQPEVVRGPSIQLFVQLPGGGIGYEGIDFTGSHVFHIKDAILAKFTILFKDLDPSALHLFKLDGSSRTLLDPSQTLSEAHVDSNARLVVEIVSFAHPVIPTTGTHGVNRVAGRHFMCAKANSNFTASNLSRDNADASYQAGARLLRGLLEASPLVPPVSETSSMPTEHGARILQVKSDVGMPQLGSTPLFIRYFYDDCIRGPMTNFDAKNDAHCRRFIVFGNPGSKCTSSYPEAAVSLLHM